VPSGATAETDTFNVWLIVWSTVPLPCGPPEILLVVRTTIL